MNPDGEEERAIPGFDISPHWADGYAFGKKGFVRVSEAADGSLVIESGRHARRRRDEDADWMVSGRGSGHKIAMWRPLPPERRSGTGNDHPEYHSMDLRSFLLANPAFLNRQLLVHNGETRRVVVDDLGRVTLQRGADVQLVAVDELVDQHLEALRARTVLIVDKG